jgi:hypothetical protein
MSGNVRKKRYSLWHTPKVSIPSAVVMDLERALGESLNRGGMPVEVGLETADLGLMKGTSSDLFYADLSLWHVLLRSSGGGS